MRRILFLAALPFVAGACGSDGRAPTSSDDPTRLGQLQRLLGDSDEELTTQDLDQGVTPLYLARVLAGSGIDISNVTYSGAPAAAGMFSGGTEIIGFESGIVLGTGRIASVKGPNKVVDATTENGTPGDSLLDLLAGSGNPTMDAAVLSFDFVPHGSTITLEYVFASEEYNEYVNTGYNDVFAFYVNGENCAVVGRSALPVSINSINNGNPFGIPPVSHPELYRNNDIDSNGGATIATEMDGLTAVLTCTARVRPGVKNHMRLAIADAGDAAYDSNVFLRAGSLEASN
ncbi:MAG TPA: choice-of-anchor L domain-containing protein [Gemmatimonadaceae bacterium]|nr:choice-of-anchor L domain-containing protein [Gemmatimonadaceae bacterium]